MIDLQTETLLSFSQAAALLPPKRSGKKVAAHTIAGYCLRGLRGVYLEYEQVGGSKITSVEALQRFSDALKGERTPLPETIGRRTRSHQRALEYLRKEGIIKGSDVSGCARP